jgi:hypothetical protein
MGRQPKPQEKEKIKEAKPLAERLAPPEAPPAVQDSQAKPVRTADDEALLVQVFGGPKAPERDLADWLPIANDEEKAAFEAFRADVVAQAKDGGFYRFANGTLARIYADGAVEYPADILDGRPAVEPAPENEAPAKPTRRTYLDLLEMDAIAAERELDDGSIRVVTKGGKKYTLPADEEAAAAAGPLELFGIDPGANPAAHRNVTSLNKRD